MIWCQIIWALSEGNGSFKDQFTNCRRIQVLNTDYIVFLSEVCVYDLQLQALTFLDRDVSESSNSLLKVGEHSLVLNSYEQSFIVFASDCKVQIIAVSGHIKI